MAAEPGTIKKLVPDGHFYSPFVVADELAARRAEIWAQSPPLRGIEYRSEEQAALFARLVPFFEGYSGPIESLDSLVIFALLRMVAPDRVVALGLGSGALVAAAVRARNGGTAPSIVCVDDAACAEDPAGIASTIEIVDCPIWDAPRGLVEGLGPGDVLCVDASHINKTGSDVHTIYFEILPRLAPGVLIHVGETYLPFEYPFATFERGDHWNEQYLLEALLTDSNRYEVVFGSAFFGAFHSDALDRAGVPSVAADRNAGLWLRVRDATPASSR